MYPVFPSDTDWIKLSSKFETSYIISLVAAIGGGHKTKDMFVVSTVLVKNIDLSGGAYLSYTATAPGCFWQSIMRMLLIMPYHNTNVRYCTQAHTFGKHPIIARKKHACKTEK